MHSKIFPAVYVFLLSILPLFLPAQESTTTTTTTTTVTTSEVDEKTTDNDRHIEIGVNINRFLSMLNLLENNPINITTGYAFTLKSLKNKRGFRMGIGLSFASQAQEESFNSSDNQFSDFSIQLRTGYEKQYALSRRWLAYWGLDFISNYNSEKITNFAQGGEKFISSRRTLQLGAGPALGVQFAFHPRITLYTEANFYYIHNNQKTLQEGLFSNNNSMTQTRNSLNISLPVFLYLNFRF